MAAPTAPIRFEGRWIDPEQMDIWQCCDEVALAMQHDQDDETDTDDETEELA